MTHAAPPPAFASAAAFFWQFLRNPAMVGSVVPTSRTTVAAVLDRINWTDCALLVEYGPGLGTFTRHALNAMRPDARLIAIDTNARFIDHLRTALPDPRLVAVEGSAADVATILRGHGAVHADHVISGLPFSMLPPGVGPAIMAATHDVLSPGGAFHIYQYSRFVAPMLARHFNRIDEARIWRNVPPARLFHAWKEMGTDKG